MYKFHSSVNHTRRMQLRQCNPAIDLSNLSAGVIGTGNACKKLGSLGVAMKLPETKETESNKVTGSWLSLVMLCMVTALSAALAFSVLFAGASLAFAVVDSSSRSTPRTCLAPPYRRSQPVARLARNLFPDNPPAHPVSNSQDPVKKRLAPMRMQKNPTELLAG